MSEQTTQSETSQSVAPRSRRKVLTPITSGMRLLDINDLVDFLRMSESTIKRLMENGEFPKPFLADENARHNRGRRWTLASIEQWVKRRAEAAEEAVA